MQRQITDDIEGKRERLISIVELFGFVSNDTINGFLGQKSKHSKAFKEMLRYEGFREFTISSGNGDTGLHAYSSRDIFGRDVAETYFILDFNEFRDYASRKFAEMFACAHPDPGPNMLAAYTRFMHNNQLDATRPEIVSRGMVSDYRKYLRGERVYSPIYQNFVTANSTPDKGLVGAYTGS